MFKSFLYKQVSYIKKALGKETFKGSTMFITPREKQAIR